MSMRAALVSLTTLLIATPAFARIETVVVTATPLSLSANGPTATQSVTAADLTRFGNADILGALDRNLAGATLSNAQDNAFQPDLFYRGFEASPLAGDAQGLAAYANGARFNQLFGDTVNFDLLPDIAVDTLTLQGANPAFGLNAIAGSLSATFKNGFTAGGGNAQASAGSHGTRDAEGEFGGNTGKLSYYGAARVLSDDGWRAHSPSNVRQAFADLGWRSGGTELHLWATGSSNDLTGSGTSPVELLAVDRHAVFTWPDTTLNRFAMGGLTAHSDLSDAFTFDASAYLGALRQRTLNGDASEIEPCGPDLCLEDGTPVTDTLGNPIPDFLGGGDYAQLNRTNTSTTASGLTLQVAHNTERTDLAIGAAYDRGITAFSATSEVGELTADRGFGGPGVVVDIPGGPIEPVALKSRNTYTGVYVTGAFHVTDDLTLTAGARLNHAAITLRDRLGTALNGDHDYTRLNPAVGFVTTVAPDITLYAGYSEANRTPTPAELSCADPLSPCSLTNFFVDDPDLKQVVGRTFEVGTRGARDLGDGKLTWQAALYRTNVRNDIIFVSSPTLGRAYFQNVAATRRQGFEAAANYETHDFTASLAYAYIDATFETPLTLSSEDNPFADASGNIFVTPGDRMPGIPAHSVKGSVDWHPQERWGISLSMRAASGRVLRGDESNENPKTAPYAVFDLGGHFNIVEHVTLFAAVTNLFDKTYETFGSFSPTADVPISEVPGASDPRALSPAPPREYQLGLKIAL
ncbi:MAG TPA: TonB-dependent receptor [Rhizomicrobium sp.]|nr:TonB-dependent receptor [Rhizomicrobium sp.]